MAGVAEIRETVLPGVGYCHDFPTRAGPRVGVVTRTSGRRELIVYSQEDPDAVEHHVDLDPEEARVLGELLGVSSVTQQIGNISIANSDSEAYAYVNGAVDAAYRAVRELAT